MLSTAGANPFLGIESPDMSKVYWFFAVVAALFVVMSIVRGIGRLKEIRQGRISAWRTFRKLAKARGLSPPEIEVLAKATHRAKVKRPSQVLAAINVFDRVVNNFLDYEDVTSKHQAHLVAVREKLVSTVESRNKDEDRRQLQRTPTSQSVQLQVIARNRIEEELKGALNEADPRFKEAVENLQEELLSVNAQMVNIGAGGVCLNAPEVSEVRDDDYIRLSGNVEVLPFDINGMLGQITGYGEGKEDDSSLILHVRFLPYEQEHRKQIIKLVYETQQPAKPARGKAGAGGPSGQSKMAQSRGAASPAPAVTTIPDGTADGAAPKPPK